MNIKQKTILFSSIILLFILFRFVIFPIPQKSINLQLIPLAYNSPFIFLESCFPNSINKKNENNKYFDINRKYTNKHIDSIPQNVILIIVESLSQEYVGKLSGEKSYTPFLDSLIDSSLVFPNAYANGRKSIEALPAILCGLPALMDAPFIVSPYKNNQLNSLPQILKRHNYATSFFHGGTNGCLGFNTFCKKIGIDQYYGRKEFNNDTFFDGNWGIWDEPFLSFTAEKLNEIPQPFFTCIFTLSSHHPYKIPEVYQDKFPLGTLAIHQSIQYADFALAQFFKKIKKSKWFDNTLFIITGDHTSLSEKPEYATTKGKYKVPIILYTPDKHLLGKRSKIMQHVDIMPSIIDYLGISDFFKSFGKSVFNKDKQYTFNYINNTFQLFDTNYLIQMTANQITGYYNIKQDSLLTHNLMLKKKNKEFNELKSIINTYKDVLKNNQYD